MNSKLTLLTTMLVNLLYSPLLGAEHVNIEKAVFAGGCFWCIEAAYQDLDGVLDAISGFTGGKRKNPTYKGNHKGHYEAVEVTFDSKVITYQQLLDIFWVNIDPFDNKGQFCDRGPSYRSAIFVDRRQRDLAIASKDKIIARFPEARVYTEILESTSFYPVEKYHQDYYKKNPIRYHFYRSGCRRDARLNQIWGAAAKH